MTSTKDLLASRGLNCTAQRAALYEALAATKSHPTAEELYRRVRPRTRSLSLATVYSALETFCRVGLVRRVPTLEGPSRFDATTGEHVHLRDVDTGSLGDVPADLGSIILDSMPRAVLDAIERSHGVRIEGVEVQLLVRRRDPGASDAEDDPRD